jgi:hypothetical protein
MNFALVFIKPTVKILFGVCKSFPPPTAFFFSASLQPYKFPLFTVSTNAEIIGKL